MNAIDVIGSRKNRVILYSFQDPLSMNCGNHQGKILKAKRESFSSNVLNW